MQIYTSRGKINLTERRRDMPIYEYRCNDCNTNFEKMVKLSQAGDPQVCPEKDCASTNTKKVVSVSNFQLVGGGWYRDGYSK
jgi:putative FmdB family regulatory protein